MGCRDVSGGIPEAGAAAAAGGAFFAAGAGDLPPGDGAFFGEAGEGDLDFCAAGAGDAAAGSPFSGVAWGGPVFAGDFDGDFPGPFPGPFFIGAFFGLAGPAGELGLAAPASPSVPGSGPYLVTNAFRNSPSFPADR
jgi:hypothetical protein